MLPSSGFFTKAQKDRIVHDVSKSLGHDADRMNATAGSFLSSDQRRLCSRVIGSLFYHVEDCMVRYEETFEEALAGINIEGVIEIVLQENTRSACRPLQK